MTVNTELTIDSLLTQLTPSAVVVNDEENDVQQQVSSTTSSSEHESPKSPTVKMFKFPYHKQQMRKLQQAKLNVLPNSSNSVPFYNSNPMSIFFNQQSSVVDKNKNMLEEQEIVSNLTSDINNIDRNQKFINLFYSSLQNQSQNSIKNNNNQNTSNNINNNAH